MARNPDRVVTFDTETTGTDAAIDQVIELSIQTGLGATASQQTWRFRPEVPISPEAERVHGISMADLLHEPPFAAKAGEVVRALDAAEVLVGYNLRFDLDMVQGELRRCGHGPLDLQGKVLLDPYRLWQRCEPRSLADAHRRFVGADFDGAHSAAADVAATARVLEGMIAAFSLDERGWDEIERIAEPERQRWIGASNHLQWNDDGEVVVGFGKNAGRPLWEFSRSSDGRGWVNWVLRSDFPPHVQVILHALGRAQDHQAWRDGLIARFGPPPVVAAEVEVEPLG